MKTKPFVKWAGGKKSALIHLRSRLPNKYENYYECFLGGGALFFDIQPKKAVLSDVNEKLILTYKAIREDVNRVIESLKIHKENNSKEYFLKQRDLYNKETDLFNIAGIFIYLNKTCFNGLYRENKKGEFNVPYGKYKNPQIIDEENLRKVSTLLKNVKLKSKSFKDIKIEKGAFYYLDPPYFRAFNQYNKNQFLLSEHKQLRDFCNEINKKKAYFMLSNSNTDEIKKLYKGFNIEIIKVGKSISCKSKDRGKKEELVIRNYQ